MNKRLIQSDLKLLSDSELQDAKKKVEAAIALLPKTINSHENELFIESCTMKLYLFEEEIRRRSTSF